MSKWLDKIVAFLRREGSNWTPFELGWMFFCCAVIVGLSIYWDESWIGIISSLTGILYTLFAGKGKLSCYLFGIVNTVLYGYISYRQRYYGEVMLNWGYYFPMQFVGLYFWGKHTGLADGEVIKRRLTWHGRALAFGWSAAGWLVYGGVLAWLGGNRPFTDSFTTVFSVTAMVLTVRRCVEQWMVWIAVNTVSIFLWLAVFLEGQQDIATLLMWCVFLANGFIMLYKWQKGVKAA